MSRLVDSNNSASLTKTAAWQALDLICRQQKHSQLRIADYFTQDPQRFNRFSLDAAGILLDYSKNQLTEEILALLLQLAEQAEMQQAIAAMFAGKVINNTEQRPALHVALRSQKQETSYEQEVHATLD